MTYSPTTLLLGCGYTLSRVARLLGADAVLCTTQSVASAASLQAENFVCEPIVITDTERLRAVLDRYPSITTIVDGVPPIFEERGDTGTLGPRSVLAAVGARPLRIIYLSTTGVYGERNGAIVTEATVPRPAEPHAAARLACEQLYAERGERTSILRVAGIYGPGRSILDRLVRGEYRFVAGADRWTNRIHVEDLAIAITRLISYEAILGEAIVGEATVGEATNGEPPPAILNASDSDWMRVSEMIALCAKYATFPPPRSISPEVAHHTMLSNQRVDTTLLRSTLLPNPKYPNLESFLQTA